MPTYNANYSLGIQKMPEGYDLMLADDTHYFWVERATERESSFHWDKWAVYRGAKKDALKKEGSDG